jgi:hypothetical protein
MAYSTLAIDYRPGERLPLSAFDNLLNAVVGVGANVQTITASGTITVAATETAIIRTGGASDGTTPQSRKLATTANVNWAAPFNALPITFWNTVVGSPVTVTLQATSNLAAGAFPNKDDIWLEVEYPGSTLTPLGAFANNTKADNLAAAAAYTSSGAAWAGSPAGGVFAMSVTFTPQMAGPVTLYVKAAKASTTFYFDPKVAVV